MGDSVRIYVHVPFCLSKCLYCDFFSVCNPDKAPEYLVALANEYDLRVGCGNAPKSIYIGGGTPNALDPELFDRLLSIFDGAAERGRARHSDFEYTVELNPELVTEDKVLILVKHGVNRVSLGVQSTNDKVLKQIGRRHLYSDVVDAAELLVKHCITNISFDFITGFAGQTNADADEFVALVSRYAKHASVYALQYSGTKISVLNEDSERDLAEYMCGQLAKAGFARYEISSYAQPGFESRHNSAYWFLEKYIGLGPAAASYVGNTRFTNTYNLEDYIEFYTTRHAELAEIIEPSEQCELFESLNDEIAEGEVLCERDHAIEAVVFPLRTVRGVNVARYKQEYSIDLTELNSVKKLINSDVLRLDAAHLAFTDRGFDISNFAYVMLVDEIERFFVK